MVFSKSQSSIINLKNLKNLPYRWSIAISDGCLNVTFHQKSITKHTVFFLILIGSKNKSEDSLFTLLLKENINPYFIWFQKSNSYFQTPSWHQEDTTCDEIIPKVTQSQTSSNISSEIHVLKNKWGHSADQNLAFKK